MPLVIQNRRGRDCPTVVCDHCRRPIRDAREGNYQWKYGSSELFFTHKGCCHAFEHERGGDWAAMELQCLPVYLASNLSLDWRKAGKVAAQLASI